MYVLPVTAAQFTSFLPLLSVLLQAVPASSVKMNYTIDDQSGDSVTGAMPTYSPSGGWAQGNQCTGCGIHPGTGGVDVSQPFDGTWHDSTYHPDQPERTISVSFTGTAVYVFNLIANNFEYITTLTNLTFFIDNDLVGQYTHVPDSTSTILYRVPVYVNTDLSNNEHSLTMVANGPNASIILFDYIVYTADNGIDTSSPNPSSTTSIMASAPSFPSSPSPTSGTSSIQESSLSSTQKAFTSSNTASVGLSSPSSQSSSGTSSESVQSSSQSSSPTSSNTASTLSSPSSSSPGASPIQSLSSSRKSSTPVGAIVGGTIGGVCVLIVIAVACRYLCISRSPSLPLPDSIRPFRVTAKPTTEVCPGQSVTRQLSRVSVLPALPAKLRGRIRPTPGVGSSTSELSLIPCLHTPRLPPPSVTGTDRSLLHIELVQRIHALEAQMRRIMDTEQRQLGSSVFESVATSSSGLHSSSISALRDEIAELRAEFDDNRRWLTEAAPPYSD